MRLKIGELNLTLWESFRTYLFRFFPTLRTGVVFAHHGIVRVGVVVNLDIPYGRACLMMTDMMGIGEDGTETLCNSYVWVPISACYWIKGLRSGVQPQLTVDSRE